MCLLSRDSYDCHALSKRRSRNPRTWREAVLLLYGGEPEVPYPGRL
jgi:hypothetical protein